MKEASNFTVILQISYSHFTYFHSTPQISNSSMNSTIAGEMLIKIGTKIDEIHEKIANFHSKFPKIVEKSQKMLTEFSEILDFEMEN